MLDLVGKIQSTQALINQNKLFPYVQQQEQTKTQGAQMDLRQKQVAAANAYLGSIFSTNPDATPADAYRAIATAAKNNLIPEDLANIYVQQVPQDPAQFKNWQGEIVAQNLSPEQRAGMQFGAPTSITNQQTTQYGTISPTKGFNPIGPTVETALSPSELATPKTWFDPKVNAMVTGTTAQFIQATGGGGLPKSMSGNVNTQAVLANEEGLGSGRMNRSGPIQAQPGLGVSEAASATAQRQAQMGTNLNAEADQAPVLKTAYANMAHDLEGFTPGPGSDWTKVAKSFANRFTPDAFKSLGIEFDPKEIASQESFNKLANQIAQAQGAQSDMHLKIAGGANPNAEMSKMTVQEVLGRLQGNQDAIIAKNKAWQDYINANPAGNYGDFSANFNQNFDPRIFQANYLSSADRQKMISEMRPAEKKQFLNRLRFAAEQGWVQ
jgi:hypothetical protein